MTASRIEIADVLDTAADHLDQVGWFQGRLFDNSVPDRPLTECPVCAMGALNVALYGTPQPSRAAVSSRALTEFTVVGSLLPRIGYALLAVWNDEPDRTKDEVLALFRASAAELRGA